MAVEPTRRDDLTWFDQLLAVLTLAGLVCGPVLIVVGLVKLWPW